MCCVPHDAASYIRQSDPGQRITNHQGYRLSSARSPAVTVRGEFVIFCHLEKSSDKVITSSSSLFKFQTLHLLKEVTKVCKPQGFAAWLFWSGRSPPTSALQSKQQVVPPTVALLCATLQNNSSVSHIKRKQHSITAQHLECMWKCACRGVPCNLRAPLQMER